MHSQNLKMNFHKIINQNSKVLENICTTTLHNNLKRNFFS